jgi:hypothetical protein
MMFTLRPLIHTTVGALSVFHFDHGYSQIGLVSAVVVHEPLDLVVHRVAAVASTKLFGACKVFHATRAVLDVALTVAAGQSHTSGSMVPDGYRNAVGVPPV